MSILTQRHPALASLSDDLLRTGRWQDWRASSPRLAEVVSLDDALRLWRREHSRCCYETLSALVALGSRRGGDDSAAALAVVVLLHDGLVALARDLHADSMRHIPLDDIVDDAINAVWETVRRSAPDLGPRVATFVLRRARKLMTTPERRSRPPQGRLVSLEALVAGADGQTRGQVADLGGRWAPVRLHDEPFAEPFSDPRADLEDLLAWARGHGVLLASEVDLVAELIAVQRAGARSEAAHQIVGQRHGVTVRTIRRRRAAVVQRLRAAAPNYLAAVS